MLMKNEYVFVGIIWYIELAGVSTSGRGMWMQLEDRLREQE